MLGIKALNVDVCKLRCCGAYNGIGIPDISRLKKSSCEKSRSGEEQRPI